MLSIGGCALIGRRTVRFCRDSDENKTVTAFQRKVRVVLTSMSRSS